MPPLSEWGKQTVTKKNDQNILVKQQPKLSEYTRPVSVAPFNFDRGLWCVEGEKPLSHFGTLRWMQSFNIMAGQPTPM